MTQAFIRARFGFYVNNDFERAGIDTPIELAPNEGTAPNHVIGYIAGDANSPLRFMRTTRVRVQVHKDGIVTKSTKPTMSEDEYRNAALAKLKAAGIHIESDPDDINVSIMADEESPLRPMPDLGAWVRVNVWISAASPH